MLKSKFKDFRTLIENFSKLKNIEFYQTEKIIHAKSFDFDKNRFGCLLISKIQIENHSIQKQSVGQLNAKSFYLGKSKKRNNLFQTSLYIESFDMQTIFRAD